MFVISLLCAVFLLASEAPPLKLAITPHIGLAPLTIRARTTTQRHADNRQLCLQVASAEGFDQRSCWDVDGVDAAVTRDTFFKDLPGGHYTVRVILLRANNTTFHVDESFESIFPSKRQ